MKIYNPKNAVYSLPTTTVVEVLNPENGSTIGSVPAMKKEDIDKVYSAAKSTQIEWKNLSISERAVYLRNWANLLLKHKEYLAQLLTKEIAKPYNDALVEVERSAEYIEYTIEEMYRIEVKARSSEQFYNQGSNKIAITNQIPMGVVLAISPFNYPINLAISKIAPALISGNTVVFKPATQGSIVGIEITNLLIETGIPQGVLSTVTGRGRDIGDYLISCNKADMISFTGGTKVGSNISQMSVMTPHVLELGGKDAAIILDEDNLDLDFITKEIISGAFSYSGQRCTAIKRVLVPRRYYADVKQLLIDKTNQLSVGSALDNKFITPLIDNSSSDYIQSLVDDAVSKGAKLLTPFKRNGNLITPVLIDNVNKDMDVYYEEPFGPLLPLIPYDSIEEAIEIHNDSQYGLQASVFGNNISNVFAVSNQLEVGSVNINGKTSRGPDNFSFTGVKQSGFGVQGISDSIYSMTKPKTIVINK